MKTCEIIKTPIGFIQIFSKKNKILKIEFLNNFNESHFNFRITEMSLTFDNYFKHKNKNLYANLKIQGSTFQKMVWNEISKIPYGSTRTYKDIAISLGKPTASRAVANACKRNKLAIIIPCHRVIGKNNKDGYFWGKERKRWLLKLEKNN